MPNPSVAAVHSPRTLVLVELQAERNLHCIALPFSCTSATLSSVWQTINAPCYCITCLQSVPYPLHGACIAWLCVGANGSCEWRAVAVAEGKALCLRTFDPYLKMSVRRPTRVR